MKSYDLSNLTVLITEKHSQMRTLFRQVMRQLGIPNIYDANNPEEGFVRFNDFKPDIMFIDWSPGFDGLELVQAVRKSEKTTNPFAATIMVSAFTETHQIKAARDAGVTEYLAKPVSAQRFYDRIVSVVESKRPFVRVDTFFGPDRRRLNRPYGGKERRSENLAFSANKLSPKTKKQGKASDGKTPEADSPGNEASS